MVGFRKVGSGKGGLTYEESLCVGWIDGVVNRVDGLSYRQRFTPRRRGSIWSAVNLAKVAKLKAWEYFEAQPPGYRRLMEHWVASARKEEARERRIE